jgi:ATP-binding protein involved in chromosome partitioning
MPLPIYQPKTPSHPLEGIKFIVGIAAGKGGVGKTSITVNLALALKAKGYQVGVLDTDIYGPSVRKMLPEDRLPYQKGQLIFPALCSGIKMISMAYFRRENEAAAVRAPIANGLITQFIKNVEWGQLDFLLIDFPPGTGDVQLTLSQQANLTGAIMVTTPQEVAVMDVRKAMHLFYQVKIPIVGIIENMSYYWDAKSQEPIYLFGRGGGERLANETGVPFLGKIPIDPILCENGDKGLSLFSQDPDCKKSITQAFMNLADQLDVQLQALTEQDSSSLQNFELIWKEMENV